jgi:hypothetical protein
MIHPIGRSDTVLPAWDAEAKFEPLWEAPVPVSVPDEPEDVSRVIEDSYRKGFEEGQASAEGSFAEALDAAKRSLQAEMLQSQEEDFKVAVNELSDRLGERLSGFEKELRLAVFNVLGPIVSRQITSAEQGALLSSIDRMIELNGLAEVKIAGPEKYLEALSFALADRGLAAATELRDGPDIIVLVDEVELRTRLPEWIKKLEALLA